MTDPRQLLLFQRSTLLDAAIGCQARYAARLARIDNLREELYVSPERHTAPQKLKVWNVTMMDALSQAREEAQMVLHYFNRIRQIDERLAQLPAA